MSKVNATDLVLFPAHPVEMYTIAHELGDGKNVHILHDRSTPDAAQRLEDVLRSEGFRAHLVATDINNGQTVKQDIGFIEGLAYGATHIAHAGGDITPAYIIAMTSRRAMTLFHYDAARLSIKSYHPYPHHFEWQENKVGFSLSLKTVLSLSDYVARPDRASKDYAEIVSVLRTIGIAYVLSAAELVDRLCRVIANIPVMFTFGAQVFVMDTSNDSDPDHLARHILYLRALAERLGGRAARAALIAPTGARIPPIFGGGEPRSRIIPRDNSLADSLREWIEAQPDIA